jgi:hypothetical protein
MQNETNLGGTPAIDPADETVFELIEVRGHLAGIAPITDPPGSGDVVLAREDRANWRIGYQVDPATSYKIVVAVYCDDAQAATCDGI